MNEIKFKRRVALKGTSPGITIPVPLMEFLEVPLGTTLILIGKTGKMGKYLAVFEEKEKE